MGHNQTKRGSDKKQKIQNFVFKFFTLIRLNNETEKEYLLSQGTNENKLLIIPLIVSQKIFKLVENNGERKDIVYLGNVTVKKNLKTILKALGEVRKTKPDTKLHIIGKIIDETVILAIKKLGLKDAVILHGYMVQNEKMTALLNSMLIYVNSSTDEGQCVCVFDAALCGCVPCLPKIMSFVGVFKDKALFHEVFDSQQLAKNIIQYMDDPKLVEKHRKDCIEMIKRDYSKETIEEKLQIMFSRIK